MRNSTISTLAVGILVAAGLCAGAGAARAGVQLKLSTERCNSFHVIGTSDAPFVSAGVFDNGGKLLAQTILPMDASGGFKIELRFKKQKKSRLLFYTVAGSTSGTSTDWDGGARYEANLPCDQLPKPQRTCISKVLDAQAKLVRGAFNFTANCLERAAEGTVDPADCSGEAYAAQPRSKLAKAYQAMDDAYDSDECQAGVPFGITDMDTAFEATFPVVEFVQAFVLGGSPALATPESDPDTAACQAEVMQQVANVAGAYADSVASVGKRRLKPRGGDEGAQTADEFRVFFQSSVSADRKLERALSKVDAALTVQCTDASIGPAFACDGADTVGELGLCVLRAGIFAGCYASSESSELGFQCE